MDINMDIFWCTQVRKKTMKGSEEEIYETELAQLFSEEDEVHLIVFCIYLHMKVSTTT